MKKTIIAISLIAGFHSAGTAQSKISFDISGGISSAKVKAEVDGVKTDSKTRIGIVFGVGMNIPFSDHFSFEPGLNYTQKGGKDKENDLTADVILNYLELPLTFQYNTSGSAGRFYIGAGPSIAFPLSGKIKLTSSGNSGSVKLKFGSGADDDLKSLDMGANIVTGYRFGNGIILSLNYNAGLSNLAVGDQQGKWKNNYVGMKIGYGFGTHKKS